MKTTIVMIKDHTFAVDYLRSQGLTVVVKGEDDLFATLYAMAEPTSMGTYEHGIRTQGGGGFQSRRGTREEYDALPKWDGGRGYLHFVPDGIKAILVDDFNKLDLPYVMRKNYKKVTMEELIANL